MGQSRDFVDFERYISCCTGRKNLFSDVKKIPKQSYNMLLF